MNQEDKTDEVKLTDEELADIRSQNDSWSDGYKAASRREEGGGLVSQRHDLLQHIAALQAELATLRERVKGLEKDAERLDWLLHDHSRGQAIRVQGSDVRGWAVIDMSDGVRILSRAPTPREAIDAALHPAGSEGGV